MEEKLRCGLNVYQQIKRREYGIKQSSKSKFNILKTLLMDDNYVYKEVWTTYSNKDIRSEGGRMYFENYSKCYGGYGKDIKPVFLHSLSTPPGQKIETALEATVQPEKLALPCKGERPSFYCIVGKCWLTRYDLFTGDLLEEVYLSPRSLCHFNELSWNEPGSSIAVKSTHKLSGGVRQVESGRPTVVKVLALFDVFPLKFTGMFEVTKSAFGKDTVDAMASCGFLTTMHTAGLVRLHSMEYVLEKCKQYDAELYTILSDRDEICGKQPYGLPLNIVIKEEPPVLFQVHCHQSSLEVGGYPWHYLYTPKRRDGSFQVRSLSSGQLAKNGTLQSKTLGLEEDRALFCSDESGRVVHIDSNTVSVYRLWEENVGESVIEECFTIDLKMEESMPYDTYMYTSSGRHVRRITFGSMLMMDFELPNMCIQNVDYENELDLLWTSADYSISDDTTESYLRFHDTNTGKNVKEVRLIQPFEESMHDENNLHVDLDTVVQIVKSFDGEFACVVYRLHAKEEEQEEQADDNLQTRRGVRSSQSGNSEESKTDTSSSRSRRYRRQWRRNGVELDEDWSDASSSSTTNRSRQRKQSDPSSPSTTKQSKQRNQSDPSSSSTTKQSRQRNQSDPSSSSTTKQSRQRNQSDPSSSSTTKQSRQRNQSDHSSSSTTKQFRQRKQSDPSSSSTTKQSRQRKQSGGRERSHDQEQTPKQNERPETKEK